MTRVVAIRAKLKKELQDSYGVNPTYLSFVARAVVETLRDYPQIEDPAAIAAALNGALARL